MQFETEFLITFFVPMGVKLDTRAVVNLQLRAIRHENNITRDEPG